MLSAWTAVFPVPSVVFIHAIRLQNVYCIHHCCSWIGESVQVGCSWLVFKLLTYYYKHEDTCYYRPVIVRGDYRGWFHNRDTIGIVKQQLQYYRNSVPTIAIVWIHLVLSLALSKLNDHACAVFKHVRVIAILYCDVMWHVTTCSSFPIDNITPLTPLVIVAMSYTPSNSDNVLHP